MNKKVFAALAVVLIFISASALGAGAYLWQKSSKDKKTISRFQKKLNTANKKIKKLKYKVSNINNINSKKTSKVNAKDTPSSKAIGYIKKIYTNSGNTYIVIDYIQMLTGDEAIKAATKDGFIKPGETLDNDYYIRNQNKKLRTFKILENPPIYVTQNGNNKKLISLTKFKTLLNDKNKSIRPFWLTLKNENIQKIEEQYLP